MSSWRETLATNEKTFIEDASNKIYRNILAVCSFLVEVENGGIIQYLDNATGNEFSLLITAANEINCPSLLAITSRIKEMFPRSEVPKARSERSGIIDKMLEQHGEDDPFDELMHDYTGKVSCIESCLERYLRLHGY